MTSTKLPTGIPLLDAVLEGGVKLPTKDLWPRHYVAGKTNLGLRCIDTILRYGSVRAYLDSEHALDHQYLDALGVTLEKQEDRMAESCDACRAHVKGCALCRQFRTICPDTVCASYVAVAPPQCPVCGSRAIRVMTAPGLSPDVFYCQCTDVDCKETGPRENTFDEAVNQWRTNS